MRGMACLRNWLRQGQNIQAFMHKNFVIGLCCIRCFMRFVKASAIESAFLASLFFCTLYESEIVGHNSWLGEVGQVIILLYDSCRLPWHSLLGLTWHIRHVKYHMWQNSLDKMSVKDIIWEGCMSWLAKKDNGVYMIAHTYVFTWCWYFSSLPCHRAYGSFTGLFRGKSEVSKESINSYTDQI